MTQGKGALELLPKQLINESGCGGFVCIWRKGDRGDVARYGTTVGEFLSHPENQSGTWLIDGGWGGPPGPIHVRWNGTQWESGGFCGINFKGDDHDRG